ncbi:PRC-barrel domain-containing protein [Streptomyces pimonensis]|uniref:PRC-barrel domain-containing protein n=1 Tax=Streptomyces pimonensis TaxID=2860288 RepID=A0ABV4IWJ6_9ACTN
MIRSADIREWRAHDIVDAGGHKIGTLEAVYVDTSTDEPAMATVQVGLPTRRHLVFVPLDDAVVGPGYVRVGYDRSLVKKSPAIGTDDVLPVEDEAAVFAHYGLPYRPGANGERQLARR